MLSNNYRNVLLFIAFVFYSLSSAAQTINYKKTAKEIYSNIQTNFYIKDSGYYREHALGAISDNPISFLWPLCAMLQAGNELDVALSSSKYFPAILNVVEKYKDNRPPVAGYASYKLGSKIDDRYYDDNQWIGITSFDAYKRSKKKAYLHVASRIYHFMMSGYDTVAGGGIYWVEGKKDSKNTCSNGPGVLVALGMYEATNDKKYLDTAILIYNWTIQHLRAPNGLYYDNFQVHKNKIDSAFYSYNAGTMLESSVWLYTITKDSNYLHDALLTAKTSSSYFLGSGKFRDDYWFNAVLLRGYERLYRLDHNKVYLNQFKKCLDYTLINEQHSNGLFGRKNVDNLVGQGGMLEMVCRFANL